MQMNSYSRIMREDKIKQVIDYEGDRIFKISIPVDEYAESSVLVVARAPKSSQICDCISGIRRAVRYILSNKDELGSIKQISFVFVFPVIEYTKDALEEILESKGELFLLGNEGIWQENEFIKNDLIIFEEIIECSHIIFAWGEPPKELRSVFENRIQYLLKGYKLVKNNCFDIKRAYVVGGFTNQGYPRHYSSWNKDLCLIEWDI